MVVQHRGDWGGIPLGGCSTEVQVEERPWLYNIKRVAFPLLGAPLGSAVSARGKSRQTVEATNQHGKILAEPTYRVLISSKIFNSPCKDQGIRDFVLFLM